MDHSQNMYRTYYEYLWLYNDFPFAQTSSKKAIEELYQQNPEAFWTKLKVKVPLKPYWDAFWCNAVCLFIVFASVDIVQFLLSLDSPLPIEDCYGSSILHLLCASTLYNYHRNDAYSKREEMVLTYLKKHSQELDFQAKDLFSRTALFYNGSLPIYKFLVDECECDPYAKDRDNETIAQYFLRIILEPRAKMMRHFYSSECLFNVIYIPLFSDKLMETAIELNNREGASYIQWRGHLSTEMAYHAYIFMLYSCRDITNLSLEELKHVNQYLLQRYKPTHYKRDQFLTWHITHPFIFQEYMEMIISEPGEKYLCPKVSVHFPQLIPTLSLAKRNEYTRALHNCYFLNILDAWLRCVNDSAADDDEIQSSISFVVQKRIGLLHLACRERNLEKVKFYLRHGASVNAQDEEGDVPMHRLVIYYGGSSKDIYKILMEHKAHEDIQNAYSVMANYRLNINKVLNLKCLAAAKVEKTCFSILPDTIVQFIKWHHTFCKVT